MLVKEGQAYNISLAHKRVPMEKTICIHSTRNSISVAFDHTMPSKLNQITAWHLNIIC